jgi:ATP-dependent helicase Lhr and Lhr-like helicase
MSSLAARLEPELKANRTTIVFTNRRGLAERLAWALRRKYPEWADAIGVHHSSLSAARRAVVETALKEGRLRVVVSSCSLELGVDIGVADGVVLVHPPGGVAKLLQRVGRGGHRPGKRRRGLVLTSGPAELLDAAVTAAASRMRQAEPLHVPSCPLDVLCQQLLGMAAQRSWSSEEAFTLVRRAYPFRELPKSDFGDCLRYLSGLDRDGNDWLPARLRWEGDRFSIADDRTARHVRRNLGFIIAEEPRRVRSTDESPLGEVTDAFADRLRPGDRFLLEGRCLEVKRNAPNELLAEEVAGLPVVPKWTSDSWPLSPELARRLICLRRQAAEALRERPESLQDLLCEDYQLGVESARVLASYFEEQERLSEIPLADTCLVEAVAGPGITEYYVHTPLNRDANDRLAKVVALRLARRGCRSTSIVADLGFALFVDEVHDLRHQDFVTLLASANFHSDLAEATEESGQLREQFRKVALTGFMLLRNPDRRRRVGGSDWAERRLFERVRQHDRDFVLIRQARKELSEHASTSLAFLESLELQAIRLRWLQRVSPFAGHWTQTVDGPSESLESTTDALQRLHAALGLSGDAHARAP